MTFSLVFNIWSYPKDLLIARETEVVHFGKAGEIREGTYMGGPEEREPQHGVSTAIPHCQQEDCSWPKQLRAGLLQDVVALAIAGYKIIIFPG